MKIAILTLPLHTNYGGILQCYALQTILERMGHDVQVLAKPRYGRLYRYWIYPQIVCKQVFKRYILRKNISIWKSPYEAIYQYTDHFIHRYIHQLVKRAWNSHMLSQFDSIIVGSDQVWRSEYLKAFVSEEDAFLDFAKDCQIKRIAYAVSFGTDECTYTHEQLKKYTPLIQQFDAVSVREFSGVDICKNYFGVEACQMVDPTLLLNSEDYIWLINQAKTASSKGDLLVYILDETNEKEKIVESVAKMKYLFPFYTNSKVENQDAPLEERIQKPVEQWLRGFQDAKMVVTDSFHGCVFSILFHKPFIAIGNMERGIARFTSLLHLFGLDNRLVHSLEEYKERKQELLKPIDYTTVYQKLQTYRKNATNFLSKTLA